MEKLVYTISIDANRQHVWKTMIEQETYREWVGVSWPNSGYKGKWEMGEKLRFVDDNDTGGTVAEIVEFRRYEYIKALHVAMATPNGGEDRDSDFAKGWIGTTEEYLLSEKNGKTELTVTITTNPDWVKMFNEGWPAAVEKLKEIAERIRVRA